MNYKEVKLILSTDKGLANDIMIDGVEYWYDMSDGSDPTDGHSTTLMMAHQPSSNRYDIDIILPLNKENPKETLDEFFKLLLLA
jgi:hypothetical protein